VNGLDFWTLDPVVRHACEEVVRARLRAIRSTHVDDRERLAAKRASLDLLHFAVSEGSAVDDIQIRVLLELLDAQERELDRRELPFWPGAQHGFLSEVLDRKHAIGEARRTLRAALAQ